MPRPAEQRCVQRALSHVLQLAALPLIGESAALARSMWVDATARGGHEDTATPRPGFGPQMPAVIMQIKKCVGAHALIHLQIRRDGGKRVWFK